MNSQMIQIGIDLGTTNSEIAISQKGVVDVIKNSFGDYYTPSVFGINQSGDTVVGKKAYEKLFMMTSKEDVINYKAEIKRLMGTDEQVYFPRNKRKYLPEEISAEILKSLRSDVMAFNKEIDINAAVITIPAYFDTVQAEATKRAGRIAGFEHVVLLQEPIAAAMCYGFNNTKNQNWIVFDFGGGTFDVALISSKDGQLSVLAHKGDNYLGGKDIDNLIIQEIFIPELMKKFHFTNLVKSNNANQVLFAKLKYIAETAKMSLSRNESTTIEIDNIGKDEDGKEVYLSIELSRLKLSKICEIIIDKTIDHTNETIKEAGIDKKQINKIILVGGPTQLPIIRERIEKEIGIPIDTSVDPLTVVAKGACIFGMSQRLPEDNKTEKKAVKKKMSVDLKLNYESTTSETEEMISGTAEAYLECEEDVYIQIQNESGTFSKKSKLKKGKFVVELALESNKYNQFWIYLIDSKGNVIDTNPDSFAIQHGMTISGVPIPHSIGVAVAKRDMESNFEMVSVFHKYFEKNTKLPAKALHTFHTIREVKKGEKENALPITILEGESQKPDRNSKICEVMISGEKLLANLPEGSDVDIEIFIDESRLVTVTAYIPSQELELDARGTLYSEKPDINLLNDDAGEQKERIGNILEKNTSAKGIELNEELRRIKEELENGKDDSDALRKANSDLKKIKDEIDILERKMILPDQIAEHKAMIVEINEMIEEIIKDDGEKEKMLKFLKILENEGNVAIEKNNTVMIQSVNEKLNKFRYSILMEHPGVWINWFNNIVERQKEIKDQTVVKSLIAKGKVAIDNNDLESLKQIVRKLTDLLPDEVNESIKNNTPGVRY